MTQMDLHLHTTFSDGLNTPEEMVLAAVEQGLHTVGISDHSYTFYDETYCMKKENYPAYIDTVTALKEKYKDRIKVLLGIEQDYYCDMPTDVFDYIIGSVHYLKVGEDYLSFDHLEDMFADQLATYFGGDIFAFAAEYYRTLSNVVEKTRADIIGHFDLFTKFNEGGRFFDDSDPRYVSAWKAAADRLLKYNVPFEINMGALARGFRTTPYPADPILDYLKEHGARFILSSDSHAKEFLCYQFDKYKEHL